MTDTFEWYSSISTPVWLLVLIQITAAIAIGILFVKCVRPQASIAHRILLASLAMTFVFPLTAVILGQLNFGLFPSRQIAVQAPIATSSTKSTPESSDPVLDEEKLYLGHTQVDIPLPKNQTNPVESQPESAVTVPPAQPATEVLQDSKTTSVAWSTLVAIGLGFVALLSLIRLMIGCLSSIATLKSAKPAVDSALEKHLADAKHTLDIQEPIQLSESRQTKVPIIWLWGRKQIVLPANWSQLEDVDWYTVFLHELSHYVRKDHISTAIASLVRAILPWHPLVRIAHRCMIEWGEKACDQMVIKHSNSPQQYANTLVAFLVHRQNVSSGVLFSPMAMERRRMRDRIQHILLQPSQRVSRFRLSAMTLMLFLLLAACTLARPYVPQPKPAQDEPKPSIKSSELTPNQKQLIDLLKAKKAKVAIDPNTNLIAIEFPGGYEIHTPKADGTKSIKKDLDWQNDGDLLNRLPELPIQRVLIGTPRFSKQEFKAICRLPQLESLAVTVEPKIPRESFTDITKLKNLKVLSLSAKQVNTELLVQFAKLEKLESLRLYHVQVSAVAIRALRKLKSLRHLDFSFVNYNERTLSEIFELKQLTALRIGGFQSPEKQNAILSNPVDIKDIAKLENLTSLDVHMNRLTDESWKAIGKLRGLRKLGVWGTNVTGRQFKEVIPALYPRGKNKSLVLTGISSVSEDLILTMLNDERFCKNKLVLPIDLSFRVKPETALRFKKAFPETRVSHQELIRKAGSIRIRTREVKLENNKLVTKTVKLKHLESSDVAAMVKKLNEEFGNKRHAVRLGFKTPGKTIEINGSPDGVEALVKMIEKQDISQEEKKNQEQEDPNDPRTWGDESWKNKLTRPTDEQWRVGWTLGNQLNRLKDGRDYEVLKANWDSIAPQVKRQILKTYNPWWGKNPKRKMAERWLDILWMGLNDSNEEVQDTAKSYANAITFSKMADKKLDFGRFLKKHKGKTAEQILTAQSKQFVVDMEKAKKADVDSHLQKISDNLNNLRNCRVLLATVQKAGIHKVLDQWISKKWLDANDRRYTTIASIIPKSDGKVAKPSKLKNESFHVNKDKKKKYFLIGRYDKQKTPEDGFKLLLILPGGDGSADFNAFCQRIHANHTPANYLSIQLVAPVWNDNQDVVWPTNQSNPEKARFTTEQFIKDVVDDVAKKVKVNRKYILAMGWSSGGPPIYSASMTKGSPLTGTMPVMSAFRDKWIPDIKGAKGHPYFILHSPDDWIKIDEHARVAEKKLKAAGATVQLDTYKGGHGWRGQSIDKINSGLTWLDKSITAKNKKK